jgi:hypothetical protein
MQKICPDKFKLGGLQLDSRIKIPVQPTQFRVKNQQLLICSQVKAAVQVGGLPL